MKRLKNLITIFFVLAMMPSCSEYLDVVPDNTLTLEDLFKSKEEAWNALAKVYSYMPRIEQTHSSIWTAGDEYIGRLDLNDNTGDLRGIRLMRGLQSVSDPLIGDWSGTSAGTPLYAGIRQANVFLDNIDKVPDMSETEKAEWTAQVKFLKAYYNFLLVQKYGPIVIADKLIAPDASKAELFQERSSVEECFDYIIGLMDEAIPNLREKMISTLLGQVDQAAAKAIKARVMLFRASPFFNGNMEYFGDFVDNNGEPFFPLNYDKEKWKDAIDAINAALQASQANGNELYKYSAQPYIFDREDFTANPEKVKQIYDLRMAITDPWNSEIIWGYSNIDIYGGSELAHSTNMRLPEGYGGGITNEPGFSWQWMAATYGMTERYYTENGVPIEEDVNFELDKKWEMTTTPGANDPEYQKLRGIMQPGAETIRLYLNREPRFYANLAITGGYWRTHGVRINTKMYAGSHGGFNSSQHTTDYYETGIGIKKFVHMESKSGHWARTVKYPYPIIRMADLYLMKAEALNEYYSTPTQEVYDAINEVRSRAGVPDVEDVWADAGIVKTVNKHKTQEGMRDIILRERGIEFAFEGSRFFDMIRTKRAVMEFSTPVWGWKYTGNTGSSFFNLEVKQTRRFTITDCLWPIDLNEMKTIKTYLLLFAAFLLVVTSCEEEKVHRAISNDKTPPQPPTGVTYKPLYGGARFFYEVPNDEDLLSIEAVYTNKQGKSFSFSASYFVDSLNVYGFGDTINYEIGLYAVDRAGNRSTPVKVTVKPLESAISRVIKSLNLKPAFGSFFIDWMNELKQSINIYVDFSYTQNGETKAFTSVFSSNLENDRRFVEDLDLSSDDPVKINIRVSDIYGNISEPVDLGEINLLEDIMLPKDGWFLPLANDSIGGVPQAYGDNVEGRLVSVIDGIIDEGNNLNFMHTGGRGRTGKSSDGNMPWNVIIDLGDHYELSRIVTHQRHMDFCGDLCQGQYYRGENVGLYEMFIWDDDTNEWVYVSQNKIEVPVGLSELEIVKKGKEGDMAYMYPDEPQYTKPTRWFRYRAMKGFGGNYTLDNANCLSEITLFGKKAGN